MESKYIVFVDATFESHVPFFRQSNLFNSWLQTFDNMSEFLRFIKQITKPYSLEIYIARDHILDDGLPTSNNGPAQTLIETFCRLKTVQHVSIVLPELNDDLEQQYARLIPDPRLIKDIISTVNLHSSMCSRGINHLQQEIIRCQQNQEIHLIENLIQNIDDLKDYLGEIINDQKRRLEPVQEAYSNKSSEEVS